MDAMRCAYTGHVRLQHCRRPLSGPLPILQSRRPVLVAIELGVADGHAAVAFPHALEWARPAIHSIVKAGWLDQPCMTPTVQDNGRNIPFGLESTAAKQPHQLPSDA